MTEKIEVKLCSYQEYKEFIEIHSLSDFLEPEEDFVESTLEFIEEIPSIQIEKDKTIADLAKLVWKNDELVDQSKDRLIFTLADGSQVVRELYCPQLWRWAVPVAKTMNELYYKDKLVFYYNQRSYIKPSRGKRWKINFDHMESWVRTYADCVESELPDPTLGSITGVVLSSTQEPNSFNTVLRKDFGALKEAATDRLRLGFLERENTNLDKSFLEYWETKFEVPGQFEAESFVGHTSSIPFSKQELLKVLPNIEGVTGSAQLLLYRDLSEGYILLDIDNDFKRFFDTVIRSLMYTEGRIREAVSALKASIKSSLTLVDPPQYQSEFASEAWKQEAQAYAKVKKEQELQGRVAPENVYETVNEIFEVEGKKLEGFDYFKKQFLTFYPDFQNGSDHLLPGDNSFHTQLSGMAVGKNIENEVYRSILMERLTKKDIVVLKLIAKGKTTEEIADELMLVRFSLDTIRKNLLLKLGLKYSIQLVRFAEVAGLTD